MRWLALAALLVGCGDVSTANTGIGGSGGSGSAAAGSGQAGATGSAGSTGGGSAGSGSGGTSQEQDAGPAVSCDIPIAQVSGTDDGAVWISEKDRTPSGPCSSSPASRVQIVNGAVTNYFDVDKWAMQAFTISPVAGARTCDVSIRYGFADASCGGQSLFVHLIIPGI